MAASVWAWAEHGQNHLPPMAHPKSRLFMISLCILKIHENIEKPRKLALDGLEILYIWIHKPFQVRFSSHWHISFVFHLFNGKHKCKGKCRFPNDSQNIWNITYIFIRSDYHELCLYRPCSIVMLWCNVAMQLVGIAYRTYPRAVCKRSSMVCWHDIAIQLGPSIYALDRWSSLTPLIVVTYSMWSWPIASACHHWLWFSDWIWIIDRLDPTAPVHFSFDLQ